MAARVYSTWAQFTKRSYDVVLTTYHTSTASQLDRALFKRIKFHVAFFDEGHLLKNMTTKRYQQLMTVQAACRILLTGTPIQNSLLELLSVLAFAVPQVFQAGEVEAFQNAFQLISKAFGSSSAATAVSSSDAVQTDANGTANSHNNSDEKNSKISNADDAVSRDAAANDADAKKHLADEIKSKKLISAEKINVDDDDDDIVIIDSSHASSSNQQKMGSNLFNGTSKPSSTNAPAAKVKKSANNYFNTSDTANDQTNSESLYEQHKIREARQILKPFILRRTKEDVLSELPSKTDIVSKCSMTERQRALYDRLIGDAREARQNSLTLSVVQKQQEDVIGMSLLMNLRKTANHPLLMRNFYTNHRVNEIAKLLIKYHSQCRQSELALVVEDLSILNDFDIQRYLKSDGPVLLKHVSHEMYAESELFNSGKFIELDRLLPQLLAQKHRVLIFSQFVMMLDILQEYMIARGYRFNRMDGQTPIEERQKMIHEYNDDAEIFAFLLSTRTAGLGINLTGADTVIIHDIDFNPYNDRQAENRVHRVGQVRDVTVYKLISEASVEERMLNIAKHKEHLEQQVVLALKKDAAAAAAIVDDDDDDDDEAVGNKKGRKRKTTAAAANGKKSTATRKRVLSTTLADEAVGQEENDAVAAAGVSEEVVKELLGDIISV